MNATTDTIELPALDEPSSLATACREWKDAIELARKWNKTMWSSNDYQCWRSWAYTIDLMRKGTHTGMADTLANYAKWIEPRMLELEHHNAHAIKAIFIAKAAFDTECGGDWDMAYYALANESCGTLDTWLAGMIEARKEQGI